MQQLLKTVFLLFFAAFALAQKIEVSEAVDFGRDNTCRLIGRYDSLFFLLREGIVQHRLYAFRNDSLRLSWKKELDFPKNQIHVLGLLPEKNRFSLLYGFHQKGKTEIRIKRFSAEGKESADSAVYAFSDLLVFKDLKLQVSENKQFFLLYTIKPSNKVDLLCYDLEKSALTATAPNFLPEVNHLRHFIQALINNEGTLYWITEHNNLRRKKQQHYFEVHSLDKEGRSDKLKMAFPGYMSIDERFVYDELNRQLMVTGLYSENSSDAMGLFYLKQSKDPENKAFVLPFDSVFARSMTGEKRKKTTEIDNLDINDVILRRDGGVLLLAERNIRYEYQLPNAYGGPPSGNRTDFLYENVLAASIHPDGRLHWKTVLFKSQSSENDEGRYSSYCLMKSPSSLHLIYNDNVNRSSNVFEYELLPTGEAKRKILFEKNDKEDEEIMPELRKAVQTSANSVVAVHLRNAKLKLVRIVFE